MHVMQKRVLETQKLEWVPAKVLVIARERGPLVVERHFGKVAALGVNRSLTRYSCQSHHWTARSSTVDATYLDDLNIDGVQIHHDRHKSICNLRLCVQYGLCLFWCGFLFQFPALTVREETK